MQKDPILSICFGWDSGTDASLFDVCTIMEAVVGCEEDDSITLAKKIICSFPHSGIALHPSWYKGNWSELEEVKRRVNAAKLPEGKSRNDGLVAISPTAISEMESFACNLFYLEFGSTYTVCDFLDMTEKTEFEVEELEGLTNPTPWMEESIPWATALDYSRKLSSCNADLWRCPGKEDFVLQRCNY